MNKLKLKKYGDYILFLTGFHLINKIHPKYRIDWVFEGFEQNIDLTQIVYF